MNVKTKRGLLVAGIVIGVLLTLAPIFGILSTILGMTRAFETLPASGLGNPEALSDSIGRTLLSTLTGLTLFPVGIILFTLSLIFFFRLRASTPPPLPSGDPPPPAG